jgi:hypothetical protein
MTITAKYIGQRTVQISTTFTPGAGSSTYTSFATIADAIADAIIGTQAGAAGATRNATLANTRPASANNQYLQGAVATTFSAAAGVTPQSNSGWTMIDAFWGGDLTYAVTANTPDERATQFTQVFKSLCKDNVMYKIFIIRYNMYDQSIWTSSCESWNVTTHQPTNEVWTHYDIAPIGWNVTNMDMIVMVSPRWLALTSFIGNEQGNWAGVFEVDREDPADTGASGFPCWFWCCNYSLQAGTRGTTDTTPNGWTSKPGNHNYNQVGSFPRTRDGSTGRSALLKNWGFDLGFLTFPSFFNDPLNSLMYQISSLGANKFAYSGWAPTKRLTMPFKPILNIDAANPVNYGQANGLKLLNTAGMSMNKIMVAVDADGNASASGTSSAHWLLSNTWKASNRSPYVTQGDQTTFTTAANISGAIGNGQDIRGFVSVGSHIYLYEGAGRVYKVNLDTFASTEITGAYIANHQFWDIKYDGEWGIWLVRSDNKLVLISMIDDSVQIFNGPSSPAMVMTCLALNSQEICVGNNVVSQSQILYRSTKAVPAVWAASTSASVSAANTVAIMGMMKVSPEGHFYGVPKATSSTGYANTVIKWNAGAAAASSFSILTIPNNVSAGTAMAAGFDIISRDFGFATSDGCQNATSSWHSGMVVFNYKTMSSTTSLLSNTTTTNSTISVPNQWNWTYSTDPRYCRLGFCKHSGYFNIWNKGHGSPNSYWLSLDLCNFAKATTPNYYNISSTTGSAGYLWESGAWPDVFSDNSRLIATSGPRIKVVKNLIGNNSFGGAVDTSYVYGQFALPA